MMLKLKDEPSGRKAYGGKLVNTLWVEITACTDYVDGLYHVE